MLNRRTLKSAGMTSISFVAQLCMFHGETAVFHSVRHRRRARRVLVLLHGFGADALMQWGPFEDAEQSSQGQEVR